LPDGIDVDLVTKRVERCGLLAQPSSADVSGPASAA
jgi:hypothetical protein